MIKSLQSGRLPVLGLHGAPRSGTTWLGQVFNSNAQVLYRFQPFFSHAFRGRVEAASSSEELLNFFTDLAQTQDDFVLQQGASRLPAALPAFEKLSTSLMVYKEVRFHHLLPHFLEVLPDFRAIGIVRDPRAVLASWVKAPREFSPDWVLSEEWRHAARKNAGLRENWYGFDRWKALAELFLSLEARYPDRFRIVRYEDAVTDPQKTAAFLFQFAGVEISGQTTRFINESTTTDDCDPYGVHRDLRKATPLSAGFDPVISEIVVDELTGSALSRFLA